MRLFLILAPLGMLLLTSCMPAGGSSSTGNGTAVEPGGGSTEKLASNRVSHEQIAAVASVGKLPPPRDMVAARDNTCPVHHEKMKIEEIPIVFESAGGTEGESTNAPGTDAFPFGAETIASTGNALLPGEPVTARVYQCATCISGRKADERRKQSAQLAKPE